MLAQIPAKLINIPVSELQRETVKSSHLLVRYMRADYLFSDDGAFTYACFDGKLILLTLNIYNIIDLN